MNGPRLEGAIELTIDQYNMEIDDSRQLGAQEGSDLEYHESVVEAVVRLHMLLACVRAVDSQSLNQVMDNVIDEWEDTRNER